MRQYCFIDSPARVIDYCRSACSSAKAALRQQTTPKTGSPLCRNLLRALFSKYRSSALSVVVTVPVPRLDPVPGLLWVINTLDEWPLQYTLYHPVPLLQNRMVSGIPTLLGEFATAKGECSTMPPTTCTIPLPTAATVHQSLLHAECWLIVATLPSYHGSIPYGPFYHACTKPTGSAYMVLDCSRLRDKTIGINECCQCHHSIFGWQYRVTSSASSCRPCTNEFLMVFMFRSVRRPLPCSFGWLSLSLDLPVIPPSPWCNRAVYA